MSKPRVFYVFQKGIEINGTEVSLVVEPVTGRDQVNTSENTVHVIEKSAYDKAVETLKWMASDEAMQLKSKHLVYQAETTLKELGEL